MKWARMKKLSPLCHEARDYVLSCNELKVLERAVPLVGCRRPFSGKRKREAREGTKGSAICTRFSTFQGSGGRVNPIEIQPNGGISTRRLKP